MSTWIDTGTEWKHLTTGDTAPGAAPGLGMAALGASPLGA